MTRLLLGAMVAAATCLAGACSPGLPTCNTNADCAAGLTCRFGACSSQGGASSGDGIGGVGGGGSGEPSNQLVATEAVESQAAFVWLRSPGVGTLRYAVHEGPLDAPVNDKIYELSATAASPSPTLVLDHVLEPTGRCASRLMHDAPRFTFDEGHERWLQCRTASATAGNGLRVVNSRTGVERAGVNLPSAFNMVKTVEPAGEPTRTLLFERDGALASVWRTDPEAMQVEFDTFDDVDVDSVHALWAWSLPGETRPAMLVVDIARGRLTPMVLDVPARMWRRALNFEPIQLPSGTSAVIERAEKGPNGEPHIIAVRSAEGSYDVVSPTGVEKTVLFEPSAVFRPTSRAPGFVEAMAAGTRDVFFVASASQHRVWRIDASAETVATFDFADSNHRPVEMQVVTDALVWIAANNSTTNVHRLQKLMFQASP